MKFDEYFNIDSYRIQNYAKPFLVAEIGLNHNNDEEIGKRTIQSAKKSGAHAVKFQTYRTEEFIDEKDDKAKFLYQIFKQYELSEKKLISFQKTAIEEGLVFFSTPLCNSSVDLLVSLKVPVLKIASGDIVNKQLLFKSIQSGLPLFISSGASDEMEIQRTIDFLVQNNKKDVCFLHCRSVYPTKLNQINLRTLDYFKNLTNGPIGFSDHTIGWEAAVAAVCFGVAVIEKHFTLDQKLDGPDHSISANPIDFREMSNKIEIYYSMMGEKNRIPLEEEVNGRFFGRRCIDKNSGLALRPDKSLIDKKIQSSWQN